MLGTEGVKTMADKEERILITKVSGDCRNLRFMDDNAELAGIEPGYYCAAYPHGGWEKIDQKECENCTREKYLIGITRQEAIDIMAKALCSTPFENCETCIGLKNKKLCKQTLESMKGDAAVALNALLEGVKK